MASPITGMAHVVLNVRHWAKTTSYYKCLLSHLELTCVADSAAGRGSYETEPFLYFVGGKTAIAFHEVTPEFADVPFHQRRVGLHHMCLRARNVDVVKGVEQLHHDKLAALGGELVRPAEEGSWAPGYYSVLLRDPEGMNFEVNHVPGHGLLGLDEKIIQSESKL